MSIFAAWMFVISRISLTHGFKNCVQKCTSGNTVFGGPALKPFKAQSEEKNWLENRACEPSEHTSKVQGHNVVVALGRQVTGRPSVLWARSFYSLSSSRANFIESSLDKTSFVEALEHFMTTCALESMNCSDFWIWTFKNVNCDWFDWS